MASAPRPVFGAQSGLTNDDLVRYIDFSLIGLLGAVTLFYVSRTISRYAHLSGRTEGWVLLRGNGSERYPRARTTNKSEASIRDKDLLSRSTTVTHQYPPDRSVAVEFPKQEPSSVTHIGSMPTLKARFAGSNGRGNPGVPPTHVPGYRSFVPAIRNALDYNILGYSVQQMLVLSVYLAITCIGLFYQSNPKTNTNRAGFLVMSQMPVVFALATKNSFITLLTGISYEQLNFLHRWVGQLMFLASLFHFVGKLVLFTELRIVSMEVKANSWGVVTFSALCLLAVGSRPWMRTKLYSIFFYSHIIGLIAFMIGLWKHQPEVAPPYIGICIALYAADQAARLVKTRLRRAILTPIPEADSTHIFVPQIDKGWVAGQHVRIRILSFRLGSFRWAECHPFTIANSGEGAPEGLTLVCKSAGDWTAALFRMANSKPNSEEHRSAYILIEGPYGGPGNTIFASFSGVVLVLGGSGITFGTAVLEDLVAKRLSGNAHAMCINFIWAVPHPSAADPYLSTFVEIAQQAAEIPDLKISITIFYTRGADNAFGLRTRLPHNVQVRNGRPDLKMELEETFDNTLGSISSTQSPKNGVLLAGCGPDSLISSMYAAKASASPESQKAVGGLELHTEVFGW